MKNRLAVLLMVLSIAFMVIPVAQYAHATGGVVQTASTYCQSIASPTFTLTCTAFFGSSVSASDYLIAVWTMGNGSVATCLSGSSCTLEDSPNIGLDYQDLTGGIFSPGSSVPLWGHMLIESLGVAGNAGFINTNGVGFSFSLSNGEEIATEVNVYAVEVSNLDPTGYSCPGSFDCQTSSTGTTYTMSPINPGADGNYLYLGFVAVSNSATLTPDAAYTTITPGGGIGGFNLNSVGQYKVITTDGGAILGTIGSSSEWLMVGEIFGIGSSSVQVTIQTSPPNILNALIIDGTTYSTTQTFTWVIGTTHNVTAESLAGGAYGYHFSKWSNGGARSQGAYLVTGTLTLTAFYQFGPYSGGTGCNQPTAILQLQVGCWLPADVHYYSTATGIPLFLGLIVGNIDMAIFIKTRNAVIAAVVFTVAVSALGAALPGVFTEIAYGTLALATAGIIYKVATLRS